MTATIRDVARAAGVSPSTVSRALSKPDLVSSDTRDRVRSAADRLGYAATWSATRPSGTRTGNLGVVVPDIRNPLFVGIIKGAEARARENDYLVVVSDTDEDVTAEAALLRALVGRVDGLMVCSPRSEASAVAAMVGDVPLVFLHRTFDDLPSVTIDHADGTAQAVDHLAALGHRRIGYVAGPKASPANLERERGMREATTAQDVELIEFRSFPPRFEGGVAAGDRVAASGVTGVVTFNDVLAFGVIARLRERGLSVPGDISVIGFDDIPMSRMTVPPLTSVSMPQELAGRACIELLLAHIAGGLPPEHRRVELPSHLMVRGTTGVAPR